VYKCPVCDCLVGVIECTWQGEFFQYNIQSACVFPATLPACGESWHHCSYALHFSTLLWPSDTPCCLLPAYWWAVSVAQLFTRCTTPTPDNGQHTVWKARGCFWQVNSVIGISFKFTLSSVHFKHSDSWSKETRHFYLVAYKQTHSLSWCALPEAVASWLSCMFTT